MNSLKIRGQIVDIPAQNIFYGEVSVVEGKIESIISIIPPPQTADGEGFILPGFIDSHVHI